MSAPTDAHPRTHARAGRQTHVHASCSADRVVLTDFQRDGISAGQSDSCLQQRANGTADGSEQEGAPSASLHSFSPLPSSFVVCTSPLNVESVV